jgi:hypothetical protein
MIGTKFGRLTIVKDIGLLRSPFSNRARYKVQCECECGKKVKVRLDSLKAGKTESCGCLNKERVAAYARGVNRSKIVVGRTYGKLTVLERGPNNKRGNAVYTCQCACGAECRLIGTKLTSGLHLECRKCSYAPHLVAIHAMRTLPLGIAACRAAYLQTKKTAESRGHVWEITIEDWKAITQLPCHYCGSPPSNHSKSGYGRNGGFSYNGLDRVVNDVGYVLKNIVPCCKRCNHAKSDQSVEEFITWARSINEHTKGIAYDA